MSGFVYLLADSGKDYTYKIGLTTGSVEKRVKELQTGNAGEIYVCRKFKTDYPQLLEQFLHRQYCKEHVRGEWFELNDEDVMVFEENCRRGLEVLESMTDNPFFKKKLIKK